MLVNRRMRTVPLALALVTASASAVSAGGYVAPGVGTSPASSGDLQLREDGRSMRLQIGYRFGRFSVEGIGAKADLLRMDGAPMNWMTVGVAGRYNHPLGDQFEVFGRAGLQHSSVEQDNYDNSFGGNGFLIGAGMEYRIPTAVVGASIFIDYTIEDTDTTSPQREPSTEWGLTTRVWTLGAIMYL